MKPWKPGGWNELIIDKMLDWRTEYINRVAFRIALKNLPFSNTPTSASRAQRDRLRQIGQIFSVLAGAGIVEEHEDYVKIIDRKALRAIRASKVIPFTNMRGGGGGDA